MLGNGMYAIIGQVFTIITGLFSDTITFQKCGLLIKQLIGNQPWHVIKHIGEVATAMNANTMHHKTFVDAQAFMQLLENQNSIDDVELIIPEMLLINGTVCPIRGMLKAYGSRYAMDGNGNHVGYDNYILSWPLYDRKQLELDASAYPWLVSRFAIVPDQFEVINIDPAMSDEDLCDECKQCKASNPNFYEDLCDECNQYSAPDEDFIYQDVFGSIEYALEHGRLIEAEFIKTPSQSNNDNNEFGTRVWSIGDYEVDLDAITSEIKSDDYDPSLWNQPNDPIPCVAIDMQDYKEMKRIIELLYTEKTDNQLVLNTIVDMCKVFDRTERLNGMPVDTIIKINQ